MPVVLTILIDLLMAILLAFRIIKNDQVVSIISVILQAMLFIDLLAIVFLRNPKRKVTEVNTPPVEMSRRNSRKVKVTKPVRSGFFIQVSCIIALLLLAYYVYSVIYLFIN
ncbi:hypothetical protein [Enterococcus hermanniensis]|uniref:hypothetical protein n=1 Tax=Enterococcus hermanniensis TaxID=249189 RepID=UPI0008FFEE2C|nr:hypothetical protein [Enterococcus hermanniensis]